MKKKIKDNIIYIYMFLYILTPIFTMIGNYFKISDVFVWYLPNIIMLYYGLKTIVINIKNIKRKEILIYGFILIISLISCIFAKDKFIAFFGENYRLSGIITWISYLGFFSLGNKLKDQTKNKTLAKSLIITATIVSLFCIFKPNIIYRLFKMNKDYYYFYRGPFFHFNHMGYYLLIANICSIFLFIYSNKTIDKIIYFIINYILMYTLIINDTFGAFISYVFVLIGMIIYYIIKKQKLINLSIIFITFIIACLTTYRDNYNVVYRNLEGTINDASVIANSDNPEDMYSIGTDRGKLWAYGLKFATKKPILGYGFDNVGYEYYKNDIEISKPHNLILELTLDTGIITMILYFSLVGMIVIKRIKEFKSLTPTYALSLFVILGYLINSMFGNAMFYIFPYFCIFLGITSQDYFNNKRKKI